MTPAQYSKSRGISRQAVHKAISGGRLELDPETGLIIPDKSDQLRDDGRKGGDTPQELTESRRREAAARADLAEMRAAERRGSLLDADQTARRIFEQARQTRNALIAIPDRVAALVAPVAGDRAAVKRIMAEEIDRVLLGLSEWGKRGTPADAEQRPGAGEAKA